MSTYNHTNVHQTDNRLNFCWTVNEDYKFVLLDSTIEKHFKHVFGVTPELNKSMIDSVSKIDINLAERWKRLYELAKEKGNVNVEEIYRDNQQVMNIRYDLNTSKVSTTSYLITASANDVTHKRNVIGPSESKLMNSFIENSDSAMWIIDSEKRLVRYNNAFFGFHRLFLNSETRVPVIFASEITDIKRKLRWDSRCDRVLSGESETFDEIQEINGSMVAYRIECRPIFDNNSIIGGSFIAHDISVQLHQENLIRKQNEELKKLTRHFEKLVYSASHDLRGPVTSGKGLINLIKLDYSKENVSTCLEHMSATLDKLELAVREIGQFTLISRMRLQKEVVNVHKLIKEILNDLSSVKGISDVDFVIKVNKEDTIITDSQRLRLALTNLITNSIQFRDKNKVSYVIIYAKIYAKGSLSIEVIDNGVGIPDNQLERIFEMFHKATVDNSGAGLGLFIAKEALSAIGGSIKVNSQYGIGSKFKIDLRFDQLSISN